MCAIYTSAPRSAWLADEALTEIAELDDASCLGCGHLRMGLGRHEVMELTAQHAPESCREIARLLAARGAWELFGTGVYRDADLRERMLRFHGLADAPSPLWPPSAILACLIGTPPASWLQNHSFVAAEHVLEANTILEGTGSPIASSADSVWRSFVHDASTRGDAVVVTWAYR